jgi:hypothetical protein
MAGRQALSRMEERRPPRSAGVTGILANHPTHTLKLRPRRALIGKDTGSFASHLTYTQIL